MITNSILAYGDQLGAQMTTLAEMLFIAKENNQQLVLFDELKNFRRGFQFISVFQTEQHVTLINKSGKFKNGIINLYCKQFKKKTKHVADYKRIYFNKFQNLLLTFRQAKRSTKTEASLQELCFLFLKQFHQHQPYS